MVHMQANGDPSTFMAVVSAFFARVIVAPKDGCTESVIFVGLSDATGIASPVPMLLPLGDTRIGFGGRSSVPCVLPHLALKPPGADLRIVSEGFVDAAPIIEGFVSNLKPHPVNGGMISLLETPVPPGDILSLSARRAMPTDIVRDVNPAVFIDGEWSEGGSASASARLGYALDDGVFPRSGHVKQSTLHSFPVQGSDTRKRSELLGTLEGGCATAWPATASATVRKASIMRQPAAKRPGNRPKVQRLGGVACTARMAKHPRARWPLRGVRYSLDCAVTRRTSSNGLRRTN